MWLSRPEFVRGASRAWLPRVPPPVSEVCASAEVRNGV
jgi:hypothetical protein